ncbi:MAG: type II toxin-antitoxin system RelE/ParE family toxin [Bacteroidetes bacterium]|nr:type II toxin-antitoxin system RelE/ParE family toxin [Bacteroidota bacterium]MBK8413909.1 type II toxin-antitoxin system RelE/ParE family toxin [Bacteroidota bacterium]
MQGDNFIRQVVYYEDHYLNFFNGLKPKVKKKFNWTLQLIATLEKIPERYFKHIEGTTGLFEIRVEAHTDIYRVFCFFDKDRLVVLINGFQKKSQKTPQIEITIAEKLKKKYFHEKNS